MILWYTHWFWITILIVYTSGVQTLESKLESVSSSSNNDTNSTNIKNTTETMDKSVSNSTKTASESTTSTISPPLSGNITTNINNNITLSSTNETAFNTSNNSLLSSSSSFLNPNTSLEALNAINVTSASSVFNTSEDELLTTLETSFKEADNESMTASDRSAADDSDGRLSAAGITGITLGCVVFVAIICGMSYIWYRSRGFNRPQVLTDRSSNLDSSGYIDDTSVRDNSEEMYSLDNDSFLNSLEAMTIQNYWTDTVKHTKL